MAVEIERKYLVTGDGWKSASCKYYSQAYLNLHKDRTVRVRIAEDNAFLTIKSFLSDTNRLEFEYPIPVEDARQMMEICDCLLYTSPSPRDRQKSRMPSSA